MFISKSETQFSRGADYFSRTAGFVIDDQSFSNVESAINYLMGDGCMSESEASSYCNRIAREFMSTKSKAEGYGAYNG